RSNHSANERCVMPIVSPNSVRSIPSWVSSLRNSKSRSSKRVSRTAKVGCLILLFSKRFSLLQQDMRRQFLGDTGETQRLALPELPHHGDETYEEPARKLRRVL